MSNYPGGISIPPPLKTFVRLLKTLKEKSDLYVLEHSATESKLGKPKYWRGKHLLVASSAVPNWSYKIVLKRLFHCCKLCHFIDILSFVLFLFWFCYSMFVWGSS